MIDIECKNPHYVLIKYFNRFMTKKTNHVGIALNASVGQKCQETTKKFA